MLVVGTDQSETLNGSSGDDEIFARRGDDVVNGLGGNDLIYWATGTYAPTSDGSDFVDGGDGIDRFAVIAGTALAQKDGYSYTHKYQLAAGSNGLAIWTMTSTGQFGYPTYDTMVSSVTVGLRNVESISFHGSGSSPQPDEWIVIGDLRTTDISGLLFFDLGAGRDSLDAVQSYNRIAANGGAGDDGLFGGAADDELIGGTGNDILVGNGGTNTLIGGAGDDQYTSDNVSDSVIELAGEGTDLLLTHASFYVLKANVENMTFIGIGAFTGLGNAGNNVIQGHDANDYLIGYDGNDTLYGYGGLNTLQGGTGNDSYHVLTQGDTVYELAGEGIDTVYTTSQVYTLQANVENLREESPIAGATWTGNALDNLIIGSAVRDDLSGLEGNDILDAGLGGNNGGNVLRGGLGDDTYRLGSATDQLIELAGEGNDTVEVRVVTSYVLPENFENLVVTIAQDTVTHGNAVDNRMTGGSGRDNLAGAGGNDTLSGGANDDFLSGETGNDVLNGGLGADELSGGAGADIFVFDNAARQDLVHDFSRAEGDKVNVADLLDSVGYAGSDPFADGYLRIVGNAVTPPSGIPTTRLQFDADGAGGAHSFADVALFLGGTDVIAPGDFILN
jgi:Ca2+-binding RTX toxin-like protein